MTERERNAKVAQVLMKAIETEKAIARQARDRGPQDVELSHDGKAEGMKYALGLLQDDYYLNKQHDWFHPGRRPGRSDQGLT